MKKYKFSKHLLTPLGILILIGFSFGCQQEKQDQLAITTELYKEPFRPQYHFSPVANWMNDPNGLVYLDGEYHLFYQYYPDSTIWGPMHWGHAISEDLVHWEHLPIAIEPDELGTIFSGSTVYDRENTSGLGTDSTPPLVAIYTYHDAEGEDAGKMDFQTQGIAYSTDNGRTWEKYKGNPVLENPGIRAFRDPKVSWIGDRWVMSLAVKDRISFYSSPNLLEWSHESDFQPDWAAYGGVWECPDLFPLQSPDGEEKWVLLVSINPGGPNGGSATQYFIGDFDGSEFTSESEKIKWVDYGTDNYAGVTWSNIPESDGRRIFIGWMSNWNYAEIVPTEKWRSANTLPRTLNLVNDGEDLALASPPVEEIKKLRQSTEQAEGNQFELSSPLTEMLLTPDQEEFSITISNDKGESVSLEKKGDELIFDRSQSGLIDFHEEFGNLHKAPLQGVQVKNIRIFMDWSSMEIYINDGGLVMTDIIFPTQAYSKVSLSGFENNHTVHYLKSIW